MRESQTTGAVREALGAVWGHTLLWLLHVAANTVLVGLAYAWLWIPDENVWELAAAAVLGVALVLAALWLHGATLAFFRDAHAGGGAGMIAAFREVRRRPAALIFWLILLGAVFWLLDREEGRLWNAAAWTASWLTMTVRHPVRPQSVARVFLWLLWLVRWGLVPLALLPIAFLAATRGFRMLLPSGIVRIWRIFWRRQYWLAYGVLFLVGVGGPYLLVRWVPKVETIRQEATSLGLRFFVAYLLGVTAWLVLLSLIAMLDHERDLEAARMPEPVPAEPIPQTTGEALPGGE